jgi:hypothetical protein
MQQYKSRGQSSDRKMKFLLPLALTACGSLVGATQTTSGRTRTGLQKRMLHAQSDGRFYVDRKACSPT